MHHPPVASRRSSLFRASGLFCAALFLTASLASAYAVILKDGSTVQTVKAPEVRGDMAYLTLVSGTTTTLRVSAIDFEKTRAMNTNNLGGSATVLDGTEIKPLTSETVKREESLEDLVRRNREREALEPRERNVRVPKTRAGYDDLQSFQRVRHDRTDLVADVRASLAEEGLTGFEIHRGTSEDRVFLEIEARDDKKVFECLLASARGLRKVSAQHRDVSAFEVLMVTSERTRSAQFVLTEENIGKLLDDGMRPGRFFFEYVQF